jgi:hypothetical protein
MGRAVLQGTLDRSPVNDDGRSGAVLARVALADGSRVVVKEFDPTVDPALVRQGLRAGMADGGADQ